MGTEAPDRPPRRSRRPAGGGDQQAASEVAPDRPDSPPPTDLKRTVQRKALGDYLDGLTSELAREELSDIDRFSGNIDAVTKSIGGRVRDVGSSLPEVPAVWPNQPGAAGEGPSERP